MGIGLVVGLGFGGSSLAPFLIAATESYINPLAILGVISIFCSFSALFIKDTLG